MPTKIALKKTTPAVQPRLRKYAAFSPSLWHASERGLGTATPSNSNNPTNDPIHARGRSALRRASPSFRSSFLREWSDRCDDEEDDDDGGGGGGGQGVLATDDIRASPRLLGYLFSMIAGAVMLTSVVEFYRQRFKVPDELVDSEESQKYYYYFGGVVLKWKLWGAIYLSSAGVTLSLLTVLVHFDTLVAPGLWVSLFRDGSLAERNWIWFLTVFWAAAVHVCTSTLSVGESQANVYFTTWIAFAATATNYGIWRESAGLPSIADKVTPMYDGKRETTYNWIWTGCFSCIFAGAATDMYYNRDEIVIRYRGDPISLKEKDWIIILVVVWAEVTLCAAAIVFNEFFHKACRLPCTVKRSNGTYRCVFAWRQLEFFVVLVDTGVKFWVILEYAGVDGVIPGLSNAYFGVWGSFFNGVFCLGTWLRENKNIQFFVRDSDGQSSDMEGTGKINRGRPKSNSNP